MARGILQKSAQLTIMSVKAAASKVTSKSCAEKLVGSSFQKRPHRLVINTIDLHLKVATKSAASHEKQRHMKLNFQKTNHLI